GARGYGSETGRSLAWGVLSVLDVDMGTVRRPGEADKLAGLDALSDLDIDAPHVTEDQLVPIVQLDFELARSGSTPTVAIICVVVCPTCRDDRSRHRRVELRPDRRPDVEPRMPLHAVAGGVAVHATQVLAGEVGQPHLLGGGVGLPAEDHVEPATRGTTQRGAGSLGVGARLELPPERHNHVGGLARGAVLPRVTGGAAARGVARVVDVGDDLPVAVLVVDASQVAGEHVDLAGAVADQGAGVDPELTD